ncbi:transposase/IS protein [compost metagenome]
MPASHKAHRYWTPQRLLDWGERIGPHVRQIVEHKPHPEMGYRSCLGLLSLARQYGNAHLEAAPSRAVQLRALNSPTVRNLLKQGLDQQPLPRRPLPPTPTATRTCAVPTITPKWSCLMMTQHTLNQLHQLRLSGMAKALEEQWTLSTSQSLSFDDRLGLLLDRELDWRDSKRLERLRKQAKLNYVLILNDWALAQLKEYARHDLLEVINHRAGSRSTVLTSQMPVDHWHGLINDLTLADALLDQLVHRGIES